MKILLLTAPMTQLNTPYPATAYLTGFLRSRGFSTFQADPAIELVCKLFSIEGLQQIYNELQSAPTQAGIKSSFFLENFEKYIQVVEPTLAFLQGKDPSLALRITTRVFLPEGPRFQALQEGASSNDPDPISWAFGSLGVQDRAKYLASLFIDDLADLVKEGIDHRFELTRYGEALAASMPHFDRLEQELNSDRTLVDRLLEEITLKIFHKYLPKLVGITAPFPGNVYAAFRMAQLIKKHSPHTKLVLGGGYVNTELRQLSDPRVFKYFDFVTLDDGERPILNLIEYLQGQLSQNQLCRTFLLENNKVVYQDAAAEVGILKDIPNQEIGVPTYDGLELDQYLSIFEMLNPMHRIWSDGRWNKLTLAHGCYWKKCNFCDVNLDYIGRYEPARADLLLQRIESMIRETGQRGFHFVDEAAPPVVLRNLAKKLIQNRIAITWWGNVRFDKAFTPDLTQLLAESGCVAVSGGLEVASDRLLKLMQKGVTVEQVAQVTRAFTDAGIMVHAYLMYGFPTQTEQETVDSLERVRQLFEAGCIQSAYWHRFSVTAHSPIGKNPSRFGIRLLPEPKVTFARNDLEFEDPTGCNHERLGEGLRKAVYNYMHGAGLDLDVRVWFGKRGNKYTVPATTVKPDLIQRCLKEPRPIT